MKSHPKRKPEGEKSILTHWSNRHTRMCSVTSVVSNSLQPWGLRPARLLSPEGLPVSTTGLGCHALLQESFPTQGWNPHFLHYRWILYQLSYQTSPNLHIQPVPPLSFVYMIQWIFPQKSIYIIYIKIYNIDHCIL